MARIEGVEGVGCQWHQLTNQEGDVLSVVQKRA